MLFLLLGLEFAYEIQNGWVDPAHDLLKGAGVGWFTVQHRVIGPLRMSVAVVPVDAPLVMLGDINRGTIVLINLNRRVALFIRDEQLLAGPTFAACRAAISCFATSSPVGTISPTVRNLPGWAAPP